MTRRDFIPALAAIALPPMPPGFSTKRTVLRSPKGQEQAESLRKVPRVTVETRAVIGPKMAAAVPGLTVTIAHDGDNVLLSWSGLAGPYCVEQRPAFDASWQKITPITLKKSLVVTTDGPQMFFRVTALVSVPVTVERTDGVTAIKWTAPELD